MGVMSKLEDKNIEAIAIMLHQYENPLPEKYTAMEATESLQGGKKRYMVDVVFRMRVDKLASIIMQNIDEVLFQEYRN